MAHHGNDPKALELEKIYQKLAEQQGIGATGKFPQGHLNANDEGEIRIAIGEENGKVIINFGKPIAWIGFDPEQAKEIAMSIMAHRAAILKI